MKFLFVLAQLGACSCTRISVKTQFANYTAVAAVSYTTLNENLRFCSSSEAGFVIIC